MKMFESLRKIARVPMFAVVVLFAVTASGCDMLRKPDELSQERPAPTAKSTPPKPSSTTTPATTPTTKAATDLTGTWTGSDGSTYVIKQQGSRVTWTAKSNDGKTWAHDFTGTLAGAKVIGSWKDRDGYSADQTGKLTLIVTSDCTMSFGSSTAPFGTQAWKKVGCAS